MYGPKKGSSPGYIPAQKQENWIRDVKNNRRWIHIMVAIVILSLIGSIAAIVVGVFAYGAANNPQSAHTYLISGILFPTPNAHYLDSTAVPLAMTLPNDLSGRVSHVYRIWSRSAQPHTVQIATGGLNPTFDGTNKLATFGGAIGDGFVYEVTDKDKIAIIAVTNVVFS